MYAVPELIFTVKTLQPFDLIDSESDRVALLRTPAVKGRNVLP